MWGLEDFQFILPQVLSPEAYDLNDYPTTWNKLKWSTSFSNYFNRVNSLNKKLDENEIIDSKTLIRTKLLRENWVLAEPLQEELY